MHRILVTEPEYLSEEALGVLRSVGDVTAKRVSRKELEHIIRDVDVIFVRVDTKLDARMLELAGRLKLIASVTTGLNHIDLEAAKKKGIKVINLHGTHTVPTAEHTMALILALSRNIPWAYDNIRQGRWERYKFIGKLLNGKTLGIIGMGRIGSQVARYAKAFGMRVVAYDPYVKSSEVAMMESLDKLLREADVITIHTMLTHETRGMIGQKQLAEMKRDALIINTARGEIIDIPSLLSALESGRIAGAALDVFANEPVEDENDLLVKFAREHRNLIITPHLGASTKESVREANLEMAMAVRKELGAGANG